MNKYFTHSGDLGDIVYGLPTIRAAGGGILRLFCTPGLTREPMTELRAQKIIPLLKQQSYIADAVFAGENAEGIPLNEFRRHVRPPANLADAHLAAHGFSWEHRVEKWIEVDRVDLIAPVIINLTPRYRNPAFPWDRVYEAYKDVAAFVGLAAEHEDFEKNYGEIRYAPTSDLLAVARIIAGAKLFVGNQSAAAAIAEGLKQKVILEVSPKHPNCNFSRLGTLLGVDERAELPDLEDLR